MQQLSKALDAHYPGKWELNPGDGAFYGPKIDITIRDALKRSFQCATIQLDFQLPERFNLKYRGADESVINRPVIVHRAILGSLERFIAIITEHFAGKWPFWLSPRQVLVIPVTGVINGYAQKVADELSALGIYTDVDLGPDTLNKKIRNGEIAQYNFLLGELPCSPVNMVRLANARLQSSASRRRPRARSTCATATTSAPRRGAPSSHSTRSPSSSRR